MNRRPELSIVAADACPEEAAAVVAALAQFMRQTAPGRSGAGSPAPRRDAWQVAALREGVARAPGLLAPWM